MNKLHIFGHCILFYTVRMAFNNHKFLHDSMIELLLVSRIIPNLYSHFSLERWCQERIISACLSMGKAY